MNEIDKKYKGRTTPLRLPENYYDKFEKYIGRFNNRSEKSNTQMTYLLKTVIEDKSSTQSKFKNDTKNFYINQQLYKDFYNKVTHDYGFKNGIDFLKQTIDNAELNALLYGNKKHPQLDIWSVKVANSFINTGYVPYTAVIGDKFRTSQVVDSMMKQLIDKDEGMETKIYEVKGNRGFHRTSNSPFDRQSIDVFEFIEWLSYLIQAREKLNDDGLLTKVKTSHQFPHIYVIVDVDEVGDNALKQLSQTMGIQKNLLSQKYKIHVIMKGSERKIKEQTNLDNFEFSSDTWVYIDVRDIEPTISGLSQAIQYKD